MELLLQTNQILISMVSRNIYQGESRRCIMQNLQTLCQWFWLENLNTLNLEKSKGKFMITPSVKFGGLREAAFKHEFGTKSHDYDSLTPTELWRKIKKGEIKEPQTSNRKFFLNDVIKRQRGDNTIDKNGASLNYSVITRNHKGMLQLCSFTQNYQA